MWAVKMATLRVLKLLIWTLVFHHPADVDFDSDKFPEIKIGKNVIIF